MSGIDIWLIKNVIYWSRALSLYICLNLNSSLSHNNILLTSHFQNLFWEFENHIDRIIFEKHMSVSNIIGGSTSLWTLMPVCWFVCLSVGRLARRRSVIREEGHISEDLFTKYCPANFDFKFNLRWAFSVHANKKMKIKAR